MDYSLFFNEINKGYARKNYWSKDQWSKILDVKFLSVSDLDKIKFYRDYDHSIQITDPYFKANLILSQRLKNIMIYQSLPIFFDLDKLNLIRYSAFFYGFYYDMKATHYNLWLSMGLKKNIGIYFPFFYNHINLYKSFKRMTSKSWHYLNYLIIDSYNIRRNDVLKFNSNLSLYITNDQFQFNQLSDVSCNILLPINKFHRVIKSFNYDLDYSISSNFSDWVINNNLLLLVNDLFLNYSLFINSYDTDVILSPQSYFKYKYWIKTYQKIYMFKMSNLFIFNNNNIKVYIKILEILKYYIFNIFIFNLNRFVNYDKNLQNLFKLIYFKFFIKLIKLQNLTDNTIKINYYFINRFNRKHLWNNNLFMLLNLLNFKTKTNNFKLFKRLYSFINYKQSLNNYHYYIFKKLYNNSFIKRLYNYTFLLKRVTLPKQFKKLKNKILENNNISENSKDNNLENNNISENSKDNNLENINISENSKDNNLENINISEILRSSKDNFGPNILSYYEFYWKELYKFKGKLKFVFKQSFKKRKTLNLYNKFNYMNNKFNYINNIRYQVNNIFKCFITKRWPEKKIYYISKNLMYGRHVYSEIHYSFELLKSFLFYKYTINNFDFYNQFFIDFFNLLIIILKTNIVINFKLDNLSLSNCYINIYVLLNSFFKFSYKFLNKDRKKTYKFKKSAKFFLLYSKNLFSKGCKKILKFNNKKIIKYKSSKIWYY